MTRRKSAPARNKTAANTASPSTLLTLGCVGLMAGSGSALAQEAAPRSLGTVTVTDTVLEENYNRSEVSSPRSTAPLLDTPVTVSVIPQEVIRERAARTLYDVLSNTPGISFDAGENGFGTNSNNFSLRGFDASGSVFVDNARDSGSYTRDVFNVEAVEVVKGAAADNGRGNSGGFVNLSTKQPRLDSFVLTDVSYGFDSYDSKSRKRGTVDFNQPLGASTALRFNLVLEDSGIAGRAVAQSKLKGFAASVASGLGGDLRAVFSWEHLDRDDVPDWGVPGASVGLKTFEDLNPGLANPGVYDPLTAGAPRDGFYGLATDFDSSVSDALLGRIEYDIRGNVTLSNQLRWTDVEREARYTMPSGFTPGTLAVPTATNFYRRENDSLSNLTNLSTRFQTGGASHSLAAGIELTRERSEADRLAGASPTPGPTSLFNPDPHRVGAAEFVVNETAGIEVNTQALYIYDTITFNERFQVTGGLRGENYKVNLDSLTAAGLPQGAADDYSRRKSSLGGRLGLVFKPVQDASVYASVGTSTQPQGSYLSNPDISRLGDGAFPGLAPEATRPVRSYNYETGVKWDFHGGALSTTASLFRTDKRNVPVLGRNVDAGEPANAMLFQGYHKLIVQGVELGIAGAITPAWNIYAGALISESERKISAELNDARRNGGSGAGDYGSATTVNGDSLAFTPDFTANLWTTYRLPLPFGLTVGGGLRHVGSQFIGRPDDATRIIANTRYGKLPSYTVFNALVSWEITDKVGVRFNVDNVTNEKYVASTNWNGVRAALGPSRSYLVSLGVDF